MSELKWTPLYERITYLGMYKTVVYISGPYRANTINEIVQNIRVAEYYSGLMWKVGAVAICPHKNTALMDGLIPDEKWLDGDITIIERLDPWKDFILMLPGWENSQGAQRERARAMKLDVAVLYA